MTMLVFTREQRGLIAEALKDVASLAVGAMVFGHFIGGRAFEVRMAIAGFLLWLVLVACAVLARGFK
jgi:hypothetical protein